MHRRHVLQGLVAGVPLFAGCSLLAGGDGDNASDGTATDGGGATTAATDATETVRETATQAATATATATLTATATPPATATPTVIPAQPSTETAATEQAPTDGATPVGTPGTVTIDLSELTTYTSDTYPYSVERPADWTVDASDPAQIIFEAETGLGQQQILITEGVGGISLDTLVSLFNDAFSREIDNYRVLNRRDVTLPNDNPGAILDIEITDSSFEGVVLRGKSVYTIADGTAYGVLIFVLENAYTDEAEETLTGIVESLTIESG